MVRVLVVDDSAFVRRALTRAIEADPEIQVVGTARDGGEALDQVARLDPDLVTLDVEMPRMDGLEALRRIMARAPRPVVMVSNLTEAGAAATLDALELGALDYVPKTNGEHGGNLHGLSQVLVRKIKTLARRRVRPPETAAPPRPALRRRLGPARYVVVGASTGGPPALQRLFADLPAGFGAPVVVVQHMPGAFTGAFARRLDAAGPLRVKEAEAGDLLEPGVGYLAPGGKQLQVVRCGPGLQLRITDTPSDALYRPSVDLALSSFAQAAGSDTLAVVLTGMGQDGREGVRNLKARGGWAIAQDEASCVVYGMPRAVAEAGLADAVLPAERIAAALEGAVP
ncbi:MAG: chemotaxis response regulator protein-glutamate methylesterase [Deferrisomatales bacterium]